MLRPISSAPSSAGRRARGNGRVRCGGSDLTPREAQVLALIGEGADNAEIATRLGVSVKTVQNHVSQSSRNSRSAIVPRPHSAPAGCDTRDGGHPASAPNNHPRGILVRANGFPGDSGTDT